MFYLPESQTLQKRKTRAGICNVTVSYTHLTLPTTSRV